MDQRGRPQGQVSRVGSGRAARRRERRSPSELLRSEPCLQTADPSARFQAEVLQVRAGVFHPPPRVLEMAPPRPGQRHSVLQLRVSGLLPSHPLATGYTGRITHSPPTPRTAATSPLLSANCSLQIKTRCHTVFILTSTDSD